MSETQSSTFDGKSSHRPSPWRALWWVATRSPNPLVKSSRALFHPARFLPWLALAVLLWGCLFFPFWSMVSFSKSIDTAPGAGSLISAALEASQVRGHQRRFLEGLSDGALGSSTPPKVDTTTLASLSLPVHVQAPQPMASALYDVLRAHHIDRAGADCDRCVVVAWKNSREGAVWSAQVKPSSLLLSSSPQAPAPDTEQLLSSLQQLIRQALTALPSPSPITLAPATLDASLREGLLLGVRFATHLLVAMLCWFLIAGASASVGAAWDRRRTNGDLEALVGAFHPPWVSYLGLAFRSLTIVLLIYLALMIVLAVFGLPIHWPLLLGLIPVLMSAVVFFGLWSVFITTVFHHPRGRNFAQLLFSPFTLWVVWVIRVGVVWGALKASQPLRFIDAFESALSSWPWVWVLLPPMWLGSGLLWLLIEWRMGPRREGLREAKRS